MRLGGAIWEIHDLVYRHPIKRQVKGEVEEIKEMGEIIKYITGKNSRSFEKFSD